VTSLAILFGFLISISVSKPLKKLRDAAAEIGKGNLDAKIEVESNDEVGQLAASFKKMTEDLKQTTTSINNLNKEIAERKQAEAALKESETKERVLLDAPDDMIILIDSKYKIVDGNKAFTAIAGAPISKLRGLNLLELVPRAAAKDRGCNIDKVIQYRKNNIDKVIQSGQPVRFEDESEGRWYDNMVYPILDKDGNVDKIAIFARNITERKRAEDKVRDVIEQKSKFISTVSHELRTPLTSMKNAVSLILEGAAGEFNDKQRKYLDITRRNIERLSDLINDVLDFQKLAAGKMELNIEENDIKEVVNEVYETMLLFAKEKDIDFCVEFEDNIPRVQFDSDKIIQVLTNLINNAIKFTPEPGRVSLGVKYHEDELAIYVRDTGIGIPKDELSMIFGEFYRAEQSDSRTKGTGLGLTIVEKIVKLHGGRIEVESEEGKGTTFTVILPLSQKSPTESMPAETDKLVEDALTKD